MKVVHLSFVDSSSGGGGVSAAMRIHLALRHRGCDSEMVVDEMRGSFPGVGLAGRPSWMWALRRQGRRKFHSFLRRLNGVRTTFWADVMGAPKATLGRAVRGASVVNLHWVGGYVTSAGIRAISGATGGPLVWTLMDIAPLTGGCHYALGCKGYLHSCGRCPQLNSASAHDLSSWSWARKRRSIPLRRLTVVSPTSWVESRVEESSLFGGGRSRIIPLAISPEIRRMPKNEARTALGLPGERKIVLFGAASLDEERKGGSVFRAAMDVLSARLDAKGRESICVTLVGRSEDPAWACLGFPTIRLPYIEGDIGLAALYSAADVLACPSIEDAGPMIIPEAMTCGTPVVAFDTGGAPDLVESRVTGHLARCFDPSDFARGLYDVLFSPRYEEMCRQAERVATVRHDAAGVAAQYAALYEEVTQREPER